MKCYAFIGIQGSGKGTQAEQLSSAINYQHINIGDLFRVNIQNKTAIGIKAQQIIEKGNLVPDDVVFELVETSLDKSARGIVFDGFPRTLEQAEYLLKHYQLVKVFYLELSEATAIERISSRRICPQCKENYNTVTHPPLKDGICDKCGVKLIIRKDDSPEAVHRRFQEFYNQTQPLKNYFEQNELLTVLKADLTIPEVFKQIMEVIIN